MKIGIAQHCDVKLRVFFLFQPGEPFPDMSTKEYPQLVIQQAIDGSAVSCVLACDGKIVEAGGSLIEALYFLFKFVWVFVLK